MHIASRSTEEEFEDKWNLSLREWNLIQPTQVRNVELYGTEIATQGPDFEFHSMASISNQDDSRTHLVLGTKNFIGIFIDGSFRAENVHDLALNPDKTIQLSCHRLNTRYCDNYITNIVDMGNTISMCGTNAGSRKLYTFEKSKIFFEKWINENSNVDVGASSTPDPTLGRRFCPENPYDSKLNTVRNKNSLSLTFAQEERLMKERLDAPAKFKLVFETSQHLISIFSEGQNDISKIGFACKSDIEQKENLSIITFIKTPISCKIGDKDFPLLVAATRYEDKIFTVFTSRESALRHSVMCVFSIAQIYQKMRNSFYLESSGSARSWPPPDFIVSDRSASSSSGQPGHPFTCPYLNHEEANWLEKNPEFVIEENGVGLVNSPVVYAPSLRFGSFHSILVDSVGPEGSQKLPVVLIGTDKGRILKIGTFKGHNSHRNEYHLIEVINVLDHVGNHNIACMAGDKCHVIEQLEISKDANGLKNVIAAFKKCIVKVPIANCNYKSACCESDPYCHNLNEKCIPIQNNRLKVRLRQYQECFVSKPCAVGNINQIDCESGVESSIVKLDTRGQTELRKVKKLLNSVKGLPKSNLIKPAIIAAAELVLHRKQDKTLDESIPIPLQTSQMTVYPELVFQISILRDKIDKLVVPNAANKDCGDAGQQSHRFCGHQSFSSPISRQIWPWMAQLLEAFSAHCETNPNALIGHGPRPNICKKQNCRFLHAVDIHTLFRETSKHLNRTLTTERKFDWRPKFEFLPFEVNNQTKPFRFNYDPIKQFVAIDFHYSVDLCELIGNSNEKYRRIRKDTDTSKNVRAALAVLANQIKEKMESSECKRSRRKHFVEGLNRGARYESSQPVCKTQLCSQVKFESDATSTLKDYEFEQMMTLFAAHSTCGEDHESLKIGTRRNLNLIFGREASKSLTISSQTVSNCRISIIASIPDSKPGSMNQKPSRLDRPFSIKFSGSTKTILISFYYKQKPAKKNSIKPHT